MICTRNSFDIFYFLKSEDLYNFVTIRIFVYLIYLSLYVF